MKTLVKAVGVVLCLAASARAVEVDTLITQLKDKDPENRRAAAHALADAGADAKPAVPALTKALKDDDTFVRRFSAQALGNIGPDAKDAAPMLSSILKDNKDRKEVQEAAADALGKIGGASIDALMAVTKDGQRDAEVRQKAIAALGSMGANAKSAVPVLIAALKDNDVRTDAAVALGDIGPAAGKDAVSALEDAAGDKKGKKDKAFKQAVDDAVKKINAN